MSKITKIPSVRLIIESMLRAGITDVVLSPGSRNAPFILSFTAIPEFQCRTILDERTAAFVALGIAQQTRKPAVLCCTSGSALLNYSPAIAEAYYQKVPLIVISADRPKEWIGLGEGQSIVQPGAVQNFAVREIEIPPTENTAEIAALSNKLWQAMQRQPNENLGPIHINVPLYEPLYETEPFDFKQSEAALPPAPILESEPVEASHLQSWQKANSIMVLCGQLPVDGALNNLLGQLVEDTRVAVVTEGTANLHHQRFVDCIDRTIDSLTVDEEPSYIPELLVTVGNNIISKKLKALLRRNKSKIRQHWHIDLSGEKMDTYTVLTQAIASKPADFFRTIVENTKAGGGGFGSIWQERYFRNELLHTSFLESVPFCDLKAFEIILDYVPEQSILQMGNSSVVRYIQLFSSSPSIQYHGNRGVSGIEGCTSTAVGCALATDKVVTLISGDLAFMYDSNALPLGGLPNNLRVIVISNGGGSIFKIIEGPSSQPHAVETIVAPQNKSIQKLVEYSEAQYLKAHDTETLEKGLQTLFSPSLQSCAVMEVVVDSEIGPDTLKRYFKALKA